MTSSANAFSVGASSLCISLLYEICRSGCSMSSKVIDFGSVTESAYAVNLLHHFKTVSCFC